MLRSCRHCNEGKAHLIVQNETKSVTHGAEYAHLKTFPGAVYCEGVIQAKEPTRAKAEQCWEMPRSERHGGQ